MTLIISHLSFLEILEHNASSQGLKKNQYSAHANKHIFVSNKQFC